MRPIIIRDKTARYCGWSGKKTSGKTACANGARKLFARVIRKLRSRRSRVSAYLMVPSAVAAAQTRSPLNGCENSL